MAQDMRVERFANGQQIVKQGSHGDAMYVVRSGKVRIYRDSEGDETTLAVLEPGAFFGEMALFDNQPRSANAAAVGDAEVRIVTKEEFDRLNCDPLVQDMLSVMAKRLRDVDKEFEKLSLADDRRQKYASTISLRRSWTNL